MISVNVGYTDGQNFSTVVTANATGTIGDIFIRPTALTTANATSLTASNTLAGKSIR